MRPTLANLATLLRNNISTTSVKTIMIGQNDEPMQADLPQIQVFPESTSVELSGTAKDLQTRVINIRIVDTVKSKLSQSSTSLYTVSSMLAVCDFMEKREASGAFSTTSIIGILRNNPTIANQELYDDNMNVDYGNLGQLEFPIITANLKVQVISRNLTT